MLQGLAKHKKKILRKWSMGGFKKKRKEIFLNFPRNVWVFKDFLGLQLDWDLDLGLSIGKRGSLNWVSENELRWSSIYIECCFKIVRTMIHRLHMAYDAEMLKLKVQKFQKFINFPEIPFSCRSSTPLKY